MYAGPAGHVNTDEYLTGRAVDKTFEQFKLGGAEPLNLGILKLSLKVLCCGYNFVLFSNLIDLPAPTLPREKSLVPKIQVDVARKVQEDPLLKIRRQEEERRAALREQMLIQQRLHAHTRKPSSTSEVHSEKRKVKKSSSDSSDNSDLDSKLAMKLKKLKQVEKKESLDEKIAKKLKKFKERKDSSSSSSSSDSSREKKRRHDKKHRSQIESEKGKEIYNRNEKPRTVVDKRPTNLSSRDPKYYNDRRRRSRSRSRERVSNRDNRSFPHRRAESTAVVNKRSSGIRLSEEELEKRRREMMQNAVAREQERKVKVDNYRKEVKEEADQLNANRPKEAEFVK